MPEANTKTILLVEDEVLISMAERKSLEGYGYKVLEASSGEAALDLLAGGAKVDLVLMDIDLGRGIDGTETAERILEGHELPIVFLSSHIEREIVEKTEGISSYGYVVKNSSITVLDASIKMSFKLFEANQKIRADSRAIREKHQLLENVLEHFPGSVFWKDRNSVYLGCNTAEARASGAASPSEVIGKTDRELGWKDHDAEFYRSTDRQVMESGKPLLHHEYSYHEGGKLVWVDACKLPLMDGNGQLAGVFGVAVDITDRKKTEEELHESAERIGLLLDSTAEGIYGLDMEGNCTYCNRSCLNLLGYRDSEELIGKNMHWQIHGRHADGSHFPVEDCRIFQAFSQGVGAHVDNEVFWRADGSSFSAEYWSYPQFREGKAVGAVVTFMDITGRKAMEDALAAKSAELDRYFTTALDLLCIASTEGRFLRVNQEWEKVLGYTLPELMGASFLDLVHPDDLAATLEALSVLESQREVLSFENRYRRKDGSYRWIEWRSRPEGDRIYAAARDVTDRKLAEEEVAALLREKEIVLREVHHRIKNNMNTIVSLLSLQAMSMKDAAAREALEDASRRVRSMKVLYERIYQSPIFGSMSIRDYLGSLAEGIIADFPNRGIVALSMEVEDFPLESRILLPLGIMVNELLTNAMKYAFLGRSTGRILVTASLEGTQVRLGIEDDGVGIPEGVDFGASGGFGLMLVRELTRQLQGTIRLERGQGTKVELVFGA